MHTYYGLWIDHAKAFLVKANKMGDTEITNFTSEVEGKNHGGESEEHLTIVNQHRHEERRHNEMKVFCREIIKNLTNADEILIFGPGTAKHEFKNILEENKALFQKLKGVESADRLSSAELSDFVKDFFKLPQQ